MGLCGIESKRKRPIVYTVGPEFRNQTGCGYLPSHTCSKRLAWEYWPEKRSSGVFFT